MGGSDSTGLGNPETDLPEAKVSPGAKPSLRAQASQLLPGGSVVVAIRKRVAVLKKDRS
jgi:hypothetical protein